MRPRGMTLAPSPIEKLLLWPRYRGKLRVARAVHGRLSYVGIAETPFGTLHVDTADAEDWAMLFGGKEQRELNWIRRELRGTHLAFDVGAHHGVFTVVLAGLADRVVAVEPFTESAERMAANLRANGLTATIERAAVANRSGHGELLLSSDGPQNHSLVDPLRDSGGRMTVQLVTLDELADRHGLPDFVKLDVERGELEAFEGATEILSRRKTVFMFESAWWDGRRQLVLELLSESGHAVTVPTGRRERPTRRDLNLIARPS